MRKPIFLALVLAAPTAAFISLTACSDDDTTPVTTNDASTADRSTTDTGSSSGGDSATGQYGEVTGTVTYNGTRTGNLNVALFTDFVPPPQGSGPTGLAGATEIPFTAPSTKYDLKSVNPGSYYVVGFIGSRTAGIQPQDPRNAGLPPKITVTAGQAVTSDFTLVDPSPPDAGKDSGKDSGGTDASDSGIADASDAG
jgi:hypothetical protein